MKKGMISLFFLVLCACCCAGAFFFLGKGKMQYEQEAKEAGFEEAVFQEGGSSSEADNSVGETFPIGKEPDKFEESKVVGNVSDFGVEEDIMENVPDFGTQRVPKTGEEGKMVLYTMTLSVSFAGIVVMAGYRKKREKI